MPWAPTLVGVADFLRPGKTPTGAEVAMVLRHVVKALRRRWPAVEIMVRGDRPKI